MTNWSLSIGHSLVIGNWSLVIPYYGAAPTSLADGHTSSSFRYSKNRLSFRKCFSYKCQLKNATSTEIPIAITIDSATPTKFEPLIAPILAGEAYFSNIGA